MLSYDISKVNRRKGLIFFSILSALIVAPGWYLFQFYPGLFIRLEFLKLLLLTFAMGLPVLFLNAGFAVPFAQILPDQAKLKSHPEHHLMPMSIAGVYSSVVFYIPCILAYFSTITAKKSITILLATEGAVLLFFVFAIFNGKTLFDLFTTSKEGAKTPEQQAGTGAADKINHLEN